MFFNNTVNIRYYLIIFHESVYCEALDAPEKETVRTLLRIAAWTDGSFGFVTPSEVSTTFTTFITLILSTAVENKAKIKIF